MKPAPSPAKLSAVKTHDDDTQLSKRDRRRSRDNMIEERGYARGETPSPRRRMLEGVLESESSSLSSDTG
jgi:hypothetical protein